jgi:hypothetical protein
MTPMAQEPKFASPGEILTEAEAIHARIMEDLNADRDHVPRMVRAYWNVRPEHWHWWQIGKLEDRLKTASGRGIGRNTLKAMLYDPELGLDVATYPHSKREGHFLRLVRPLPQTEIDRIAKILKARPKPGEKPSIISPDAAYGLAQKNKGLVNWVLAHGHPETGLQPIKGAEMRQIAFDVGFHGLARAFMIGTPDPKSGKPSTTYLVKFTAGTLVNYLKKRKREADREVRGHTEYLGDVETEAPDAREHTSNKLRDALFRLNVGRILSRRETLTYALNVLYGDSLASIARHFSVSRQRVHFQFQEKKPFLRSELAKRG